MQWSSLAERSPGMRVALALLCARLAAAGYPRHDWSTIPVFAHIANGTGDLNDGALATLSRFALVTIDKFQGPCAYSADAGWWCAEEDAILRQLRAIKERNPRVVGLTYYNSVLDFEQFTIHRAWDAAPELRLRKNDSAATPVQVSGGGKVSYVFDHSQAAARALWQRFCVEQIRRAPTVIDGCFIDRAFQGEPPSDGVDPAVWAAWQAGHVAAVEGLQARVAAHGPVICNRGFTQGEQYVNVSAGAMSELWYATAGGVNTLRFAAAHGKIVLAHSGEGCFETNATARAKWLAAFLVGAGDDAYWGCGDWQTAANDTSDLAAERWLPEARVAARRARRVPRPAPCFVTRSASPPRAQVRSSARSAPQRRGARRRREPLPARVRVRPGRLVQHDGLRRLDRLARAERGDVMFLFRRLLGELAEAPVFQLESARCSPCRFAF